MGSSPYNEELKLIIKNQELRTNNTPHNKPL